MLLSRACVLVAGKVVANVLGNGDMENEVGLGLIIAG